MSQALVTCLFSGMRYEFLISNMTESMNSCLKRARKFPVVTLLEMTRAKTAEFLLNIMSKEWYDRKSNSSGFLDTTRIGGEVKTNDFPRLREPNDYTDII